MISGPSLALAAREPWSGVAAAEKSYSKRSRHVEADLVGRVPGGNHPVHERLRARRAGHTKGSERPDRGWRGRADRAGHGRREQFTGSGREANDPERGP